MSGSKFIVFQKFGKRCRDRGYGASDGRHSGHRSRSMSRSVSPKDERSYMSRERRSRSLSKSVSPKDKRSYRSRERRSRSLSKSVSPHDEENHRPSLHSPSPRENGHIAYPGSRSQCPRRNSMSPTSRR